MLDESVKARILDLHEKLSGDGKLLTRQRLDQCYSLFRSRFGPDQLSSLDGEALLSAMHDHGNRDSLAYWVEFKNDDEFPTPRFGSIAGGSALKFGVFRRAETGEWATYGERHKPKEIPVQEAIEIARKHRAQLIKGTEVLSEFPANSGDQEYRDLQQKLDEIAPDVSDLAWGHKYFSLLFPEKLDNYHSPDLQRFHILKLLQEPPDGKGRYLCAGRFVAAARETDLALNPLTAVLNQLHSRHRYWRIGTSDGTKPRNRWELMRQGDCVAIGWPDVGDLSTLEPDKEGRKKLQQLLEEKYPTAPQATGRSRVQIVNFVNTIAEGDLVFAADGGTIIGIGRVTGDYVYDASTDFPHHRPVEWLSLEEWKTPTSEGLQTTVYEIRKYPNIVEAERKIQNKAPVSGGTKSGKQGSAPRLSGIPGRIQSVLERKSQVILYGPPGTGKTYWAERTACDLASHWSFGKSYNDLEDDQKRTVLGRGQTSSLVRLCCFHPAYGYEDFIEGYRPESVNGQISFSLRSGVFKQLCKDAEGAPEQRFYLIVDEINRGDIPRIFGELLTILEKDKRGKTIVLPVSREPFFVPTNVFLLGTMNTADRSISLLDAALRRRFGFVELMPDSSVFKDHSVSGIPLGPWFDALNRRICEHVGRDARNLQIGHSYLLQNGRPVKDFAAFKRALRDDIIPLLEEYCYEDFSALQNILGNGLLDVEGQQIRHDLFDEGNEEELIQAILGPCPEISTSSKALSSEEEATEEASEEGEEAEEAEH